MIAPVLQVMPIDQVYPYGHRLKAVKPDNVARLERSLRDVGFTSVITVDWFGSILCGTELYVACKKLGLAEVPVIVVESQRGPAAHKVWQCGECGLEVLDVKGEGT